MKLRNGKFYDDAGNVVPLEHGNKEQRALLDLADALNGDGVALQIVSNEDQIATFFQCLCGQVHSPNLNTAFKCACGVRYKCFDTPTIPAVKFKK